MTFRKIILVKAGLRIQEYLQYRLYFHSTIILRIIFLVDPQIVVSTGFAYVEMHTTDQWLAHMHY